MTYRSTEERLDQLSQERWPDPDEARRWLRSFLRRRSWTSGQLHKEVIRVANDSLLGSGVDRPTEARIKRFLDDRLPTIPRWLLWVELADQHADLPWPENEEWRRANVPEFRDDDDAIAYLEDHEQTLLSRYRQLSPDSRAVILFIAGFTDEQIKILLELAAPKPPIAD